MIIAVLLCLSQKGKKHNILTSVTTTTPYFNTTTTSYFNTTPTQTTSYFNTTTPYFNTIASYFITTNQTTYSSNKFSKINYFVISVVCIIQIFIILLLFLYYRKNKVENDYEIPVVYEPEYAEVSEIICKD